MNVSQPRRRAALKRAALCLGAGLGVLGALAPFESRLAGLASAACLILLSRGLVRLSFRRALAWSLLATLSVAVCAFHWVIVGLMNIAGLSFWLAVIVFLIQGALFHFKIAFVVLAGRCVLRRTRLSWLWVFPPLAAAGDLWLYQLFPWHFGSLTIGGAFVRQFASIAGVCGLSAVLFLEAGVVVWLARLVRRRIRGYLPANLRAATSAITLPVLMLVAVYAYGAVRVYTPETPAVAAAGANAATVGTATTATIGFFQPNTGPGYNEVRNDQEFAGRALNLVFNYGLQTILAGEGRLDLLVIPESAVPFFGTDDGPGNAGIYSTTYHAVVAFLARYGDVDVLYNELAAVPGEAASQSTGVATDATAGAALATRHYYNLATIFSRATGTRSASYQKRRLVPFGEYLPGEERWPVLREIFRETSRYRAGASGPDVSSVIAYSLRAPDQVTSRPRLEQSDLAVLADAAAVTENWPLREARATGYLQPLICYEGLFPDLVRDAVRGAGSPPDFLVNLANDSWFGDVLENHQHETGARMRSIETGRYLIRPTLTGVSSVFDSRGREVIAPIPTGVQDVRVVTVPRLPDAWTVFLGYGDWPVRIFIAGMVVIAFWSRRRS